MASMRSLLKIALIGIILIPLALIAYVSWHAAVSAHPSTTEQYSAKDEESVASTGLSTSSLQYPVEFSSSYIEATDWPPRVQVLNEVFTCTAGGETEAMPAGMTRERSIRGNSYCVTKVTEGAAGSLYTQYAYAFGKGDQTVILTFGLRFPQCGNYSEQQQSACAFEQAALDVDGIVDRMAQSLEL